MTGSETGIGRIVVLNDVCVAQGGAAELALLSVRLLRERGFPVTMITGDRGENPLLKTLGVPVVAAGEQRLLDAGLTASLVRGLYNGRATAVVRNWIARNDAPDTVYHLHTWSQIFSPAIFQALEPVRDRLFITAHDFFLVCPNGAYALFGTGQSCPYTPLSTRCVLTSCDRRNYGHKLWRVTRQIVQSRLLDYVEGYPRVLAIHPGMVPLLERGGVPAEAITTIPNPVRAWSARRIPAETNRSFVFVGRLNEEKGPDLAARAARRAKVPLTIIGDGSMLESLRRDHPEVTFAGRQPPEEVARLVRGARALVMPSRYPEPYGLVAGEALWSGLPVIAAEQALIAPSIVARGAGLACDPRDEAAFADALRRIANDDETARAMSVAAFENTRDLGREPAAWTDDLVRGYAEAIHDREAPRLPHPAALGAALDAERGRHA